VAQLHPLAGFDGERGNLFRGNQRDEVVDAAGDLHTVLVELALHNMQEITERRSICSGVITLARAPS